MPIQNPRSSRQNLRSGTHRRQNAQELLDQLLGVRGNELDRAVTFRDLITAGIAAVPIPSSGVINTPVVAPDSGSATPGRGIPPALTGLTATEMMEGVFLQWDEPDYNFVAYYEVLENDVDNPASATVVGRPAVPLYLKELPGGGVTRYYWVRIVSIADIAGPLNATAGTAVTVALPAAAIVAELAGQITESELATSLNTRIDDIEALGLTNEGGLVTVNGEIVGLNGQYTVKIDTDGFLSGFGLANETVNGTPVSTFMFYVDRLGIVSNVGASFDVTSLTRSGSTATVTTASPHGLAADGRYIGVSGADQREYNGFHLIVATPTTTTITYTVSGTPVSPATGTIKAREVNVPFAVGTVDGVSTVGINGDLVIDGTVRAESIVAGSISATQIVGSTLSAIYADLGEVTAGTLKTTAGTGNRVEISSAGTLPFWVGSGTKNTTNGIIYFDTSGNAVFKGQLSAATGNFTGELEIGSATTYLTGEGLWAGIISTDFKMHMGDPNNEFMSFDGATGELRVSGRITGQDYETGTTYTVVERTAAHDLDDSHSLVAGNWYKAVEFVVNRYGDLTVNWEVQNVLWSGFNFGDSTCNVNANNYCISKSRVQVFDEVGTLLATSSEFTNGSGGSYEAKTTTITDVRPEYTVEIQGNPGALCGADPACTGTFSIADFSFRNMSLTSGSPIREEVLFP